MAIIKIDQVNDPAGWHALRAKHIGASDIAALFDCGNSYTPTLNALYHEKRGNLPPDNSINLLAMLGKAMEPFIAAVVADVKHWKLVPCDCYHEHPDYPALGCTLDYYVVESEFGPGTMQIKNVQQWTPGWTQSRAPDHVELQVQHEFLVTNAARHAEGLKPFTWGCIASLHAGNPEDVRIMLRKPDPKIHKHIIERASRFMQDVQDGNEPPIMGGKDYQHIMDMFNFAEADPTTDLIDLRGDGLIEAQLADYLDWCGKRKEADYKANELKASIIRRMFKEQKPGALTKGWTARTENWVLTIQKNGAIKIKPVGE